MKKALLSLLTILGVGLISQTFSQGMVDVRIMPSGDEGEEYFYIEDDEDNIIDSVLVSLSSDDAEQENDEIDALYDDDLDAGWEGQEGDENVLTMGMRFQNITIPKDAVIDSAFIVVVSHEAKLEDDIANLEIYADASDNAPTFTEDSLITDRTATTATVEWMVAEEWKIWQPYRTPDLKAIVQEIVNRDGWASGNAIAFIVKGEDQGPSDVENAREWEAYENISDPGDEDEEGNAGDGKNHPDRVPQLLIFYDGYGETTNINEAQNNSGLRVYPSVVEDGQIRLVFGETVASEISVYNNLGQVVKSYNSNITSGSTLDVSELSAGMYYIKIAGEKTSVSQFIVK